MKLQLLSNELSFLNLYGIQVIAGKDYTDDEALEILDQVYDKEVYYAQFETKPGDEMADKFADIADKIFKMTEG